MGCRKEQSHIVANELVKNKELEATEERKRKAKQLEMQRKESARSGRGNVPRTPAFPTYNTPSRPSGTDSYDSYTAEKNKTFNKWVTSNIFIERYTLKTNDIKAHGTKSERHATRQEI